VCEKRVSSIMLQFYGNQPPAPLNTLRCGGVCPSCGQRASFSRMQELIENVAKAARLTEIMVTYHCDACLKPIPVRYDVVDWDPTRVDRPRVAVPVVEPFDLEHVPAPVAREVREALDCLSVRAHHGFGAMARRAVRAIVVDLARGVGDDPASGDRGKGETRVRRHLDEIIELSDLEEDWARMARRTLLPEAGEVGEEPDIDAHGAAVLLSLLRDLTYQLYTRPGRVRRAAGAEPA
jgi:hypothetical protein